MISPPSHRDRYTIGTLANADGVLLARSRHRYRARGQDTGRYFCRCFAPAFHAADDALGQAIFARIATARADFAGRFGRGTPKLRAALYLVKSISSSFAGRHI